MLILVAPPLFAASIYMTLGRLILYLDAESASLLRVKYIAKIFVVGDIISFLLQCGGKYTLLRHQSPLENPPLTYCRRWLHVSRKPLRNGRRRPHCNRRFSRPASLLRIFHHRQRYLPLPSEDEFAILHY